LNPGFKVVSRASSRRRMFFFPRLVTSLIGTDIAYGNTAASA